MGQKRFERLHYMNTATSGPVLWSLINEGVTNFEDDLAPVTETKQYIADQNQRDEVTGFKPTFAYTAELDSTDPVSQLLYNIGANQQVGATVDIVTVDVWTLENGVCDARKGTYNVIPSKAGSGAPGSALTMEGTLAQVGGLDTGTWDVANKTFISGTSAVQTISGTVGTGASMTGDLVFTITAANMAGSPLSLTVPVTSGDTAAQVASKIRAAVVGNDTLYGFFDIGGTGAVVSLTTLVAAANDATMAIELTDADSTGVTFS